MSEETKTTTNEENKQILWANVPWGVRDLTTKQIQLTGNVESNYLSVVLAQQLQTVEEENTELKKKAETVVVDTSTCDSKL